MYFRLPCSSLVVLGVGLLALKVLFRCIPPIGECTLYSWCISRLALIANDSVSSATPHKRWVEWSHGDAQASFTLIEFLLIEKRKIVNFITSYSTN